MIYAAQVGAIFQPSATTMVMLVFSISLSRDFILEKKGFD